MSRDKNKYGTFHLKKNFWSNQRRFLTYGILLVVFASGTGLIIFNKFHTKPVKQALVTEQSSEIPGWWYQKYFSYSVCDQDLCKPEVDADKDGLTNVQEYFYHSDPLKANTVGDKLNDGQLVAGGFDPSRSGRVAFDQVPTEDNILGESLVFDSDIKQIINEMSDPTKVKLPEVKSEEFVISQDNSKQAKIEYSKQVDAAVKKYFNFDVEQTIKQAQENSDISQIDGIKLLALKLLGEIRTIPVPSDYVQLHKYYISLAELTPSVIYLPGTDTFGVISQSDDDVWYNNAQAYMILIQNIALEKEKLKKTP